ncbi:MAG: hypothetical protein DMF15_15490 [Verrucomicrobia bacterium]|nr:MAG: hypothetical protein DMF15_15490 [Verrucomicrobiota bacterium]PYT64789.1 MAG: hypothetical protein DMG39_31080 [Acidobacteriota bacterium]
MQRKGIAGRYVLGQRRIPGDDLKRAVKAYPGSRQGRHVQRLANMARRVWPIRMLVKEAAARRKKDQSSAS